MKTWMLVLVLLAALPGWAAAGRNANGGLIVHTNDNYTWSSQTVCTAPEGNPGTCEAAVTQSNRDTGAVVWLLAHFSPYSSPGVTVVYFGIDYDDVNLDPGTGYKFCGPAGSLEVPDTDWPYGGRGNSVAFGSPVYSQLFPVYAFAIDNYGGQGPYFCTAINPTGGYAAFVDDSNPPVMDNFYRFGCVHWHEPGLNECGDGPGGACCFADGSCLMTLQGDCEAQGGVYYGDGVPCDPNPCPQPGACCFPDCHCEFLQEEDCLTFGGDWLEGYSCDPNPCSCPPGACCFPDGTCIETLEYECEPMGGVFYGGLCEPNPCVGEGACCFADGSCQIMTELVCQEAGGENWIDGGDCIDDCQPTPVEISTWGRIRSTFR